MRILWTNKKEGLQKKGIHLYDQVLLKKITIPYSKGDLRIKRTIYIHDNIETDKKYEVVEEDLERKEKMVNKMEELISKTYAEPKKKVWVAPVEPVKKPKPTYELDEKALLKILQQQYL